MGTQLEQNMKLVLVLVAALAVGVIASHESYWNDADWKKYVNTNDNVVLPGQPSTPKVTQQAGYITVDPVHGGEYFFWAQNAMKSPDTAPVVLWMTGGPGCSSELAAVFESGMWRVNSAGDALSFNDETWSLEANMIYLDQPFNVGFSSSDPDVKVTDEAIVSEYVFNFLTGFFKKYPQYNGRDFFVTGESFGGRYVPSVSAYILRKGVEVGNGWLNAEHQFSGYVNQAAPASSDPDCAPNGPKGPVPECGGHGWFTQAEADFAYKAAAECEKMISEGHVPTGDSACELIYEEVLRKAQDKLGYQPNEYDYAIPCVIPGLCYNFTSQTDYFNMPAVQSALNVKPTQWEICASVDITIYDRDNSSVPAMLEILDSGVPLFHMNGVLDTICNEYGVYNVLTQMGWTHQEAWNAVPFKQWSVDGTLAGSFKTLNGLTFARVLGVGHMVPMSLGA